MRNRLTVRLFVPVLSVLLTSACFGSATPPPNLYTVNQQRIYNTETTEQAVIAASQTVIALNANHNPNGVPVLSDADTRLVRDFALAFDAWRTSYATGGATLAQIF